MYLHAGSLAVCTHWRIQLDELQIDGRHLRKRLTDGLSHSSRHMFQQLRRLLHLVGHEVIKCRIVQRIRHLIALHGLFQRISHFQIKHEIRPHLPFLGQHPVKGMETDLP